MSPHIPSLSHPSTTSHTSPHEAAAHHSRCFPFSPPLPHLPQKIPPHKKIPTQKCKFAHHPPPPPPIFAPTNPQKNHHPCRSKRIPGGRASCPRIKNTNKLPQPRRSEGILPSSHPQPLLKVLTVLKVPKLLTTNPIILAPQASFGR